MILSRESAASAIRIAGPADAGALARLAEACFRATFDASNAAAHMQAHCGASYGEAIQAAEIADPGRINLVCEEAGRLVGYAQLRWPRPPDCVPARDAGEIQRFYLLPNWHGRGLAQALMRASLQSLARRALRGVWLGVWEHNPRALAFYRKLGFEAVGEQVFLLGNDPQRDHVMYRALATG